MAVVRFSISLEEDIACELDQYVTENCFSNRSQAVRYLIEKNVVEKKWMCNHEVAGAILLSYPQLKGEIVLQIHAICREAFEEVLSLQHFHLDKETCLEIVAVKGSSKKLTALADKLIGIKGIRHGKLLMSRTESL